MRRCAADRGLVPLISAIGMSIFLQNWVAIGQGARDMAVPALVTGSVQFQLGTDFVVTAAVFAHHDHRGHGVAYDRADVVHQVFPPGPRLARMLARLAHGESAGHRHQPR